MPRLRLRFGQKEDRISALPDPLIHHILSFLPPNDAVATTILSKRWKPIWRSQTSLYFDDSPFPDTFAFREFINSFLTMRDNTLPILSFHLKCRFLFFSYNDFYNFLYAAITKGVQTLIIHICLTNFSRTTLPCFVLTTKTLSILKLKRISLNDVPSVDLPSLKILRLKYVTFTCYAHLKKLLSGCPVLQELQTNYLKLKIMIPNHNYDLGFRISNLVRANLSGKIIIGLEWLHNVEHLRIQLNWIPISIGGMFHNLTHLELIFNFHQPPCGISKWSWLIQLLQNTPNLQTLMVDEVVDVLQCVKEWEDTEIVPECLLSHLTTCEIINYSPINCDLQFAKYIMQNSRILSTMAIQSAEFVETNTKLQMLMQLSLCPRISAACKLLFI